MTKPRLADLLDELVAAMLDGHITFDEGRRAFETRFIQHALTASDGHLTQAAERMGIHRNTLARKIAEYRIKPR